jgi:hypothetical protein
MDIRTALLQEHTRVQCQKIASYIGHDAQRFNELMHLFLGNEYRVTQRAAMVVNTCAEQSPELIKPWLTKLIRNLDSPGLHDAVKRNTIRILQFMPIPKSQRGRVTIICFQYLQSKTEAIAVRVFAMSVLGIICKTEAGLKNELKLILERDFQYEGAAYRSRASKLLKYLSA